MSEQNRLLNGDHIENGRKYGAGQVIVSDHDLCAMFNRPGVRPRFENIAGTTGAGNLIWDPNVESIESFAARAKAIQAAKMKPDGPAQIWDPKVETLEQFYKRQFKSMTGKDVPVMKLETEIVSSSQEIGKETGVSKDPVSQPAWQGGSTTAVASIKTQQQLEAMTLQDLQKYAEDEEIDLGHAKSKADVVKVIKAHQGH